MTEKSQSAPDGASRNDDAAVSLLYEMTTIVREEIGFNEIFAAQIAEALVRGLRRRLGGDELYIPAQDKAERDAAIRARFNGTNRDEVCRAFGISKSRLYEIVGRK